MAMEQPEKKIESKSAPAEHPTAEELRQGEKRFRTIFEAAPFGILIADAAGYILEANEVFFRLLGYDHNEIKKLTFMDITHPDDREETRKLSRKARDGKISSYQFEKRYLKKNGDTLWGIVRATAIKDSDGQLQYWLGLIEVISTSLRVSRRATSR